MSSSRAETASLWLLVLAACAVAAAVVRREFFGRRTPMRAVADSRPPEFVRDWPQILTAGIVLGSSSAKVQIVEFADLECPACRLFQDDLRAARAEFGDDVAVVFVHYPLPQHRFARPAARAAECAHDQGQFDLFQDLIYSKQDSLGLKPWASYAKDVRVPDLQRFAKCASDTTRVARIEAGVALGKQLAIPGTPTVIVNGWRFWNPPDRSELFRTVAALRDGKQLPLRGE